MQEEKNIPQMVDDVRAGTMSRRSLVKTLAGLGISAVGVGAIAAGVTRSVGTTASHKDLIERQQLQHHDNHLAAQQQNNIPALHKDYAPHAVVEDSMYEQPLIGIDAIIARKNMGFAAAADTKITIVNRIASGNQVIVEWVAAGTHTGDLLGLAASGNAFTLRGVTVVVRENGKIVRESLYYNVDELRLQLLGN